MIKQDLDLKAQKLKLKLVKNNSYMNNNKDEHNFVYCNHHLLKSSTTEVQIHVGTFIKCVGGEEEQIFEKPFKVMLTYIDSELPTHA